MLGTMHLEYPSAAFIRREINVAYAARAAQQKPLALATGWCTEIKELSAIYECIQLLQEGRRCSLKGAVPASVPRGSRTHHGGM
jgi:hypothetical protein